MGFAITVLEPAEVGGPADRGGGKRGDMQSVTVAITCNAGTTDIDASQQSLSRTGGLQTRLLPAFTVWCRERRGPETAAREEAQRPPEAKNQKACGCSDAVAGLGAKVDFDLDLVAGRILPVCVTINNATVRTDARDPWIPYPPPRRHCVQTLLSPGAHSMLPTPCVRRRERKPRYRTPQ